MDGASFNHFTTSKYSAQLNAIVLYLSFSPWCVVFATISRAVSGLLTDLFMCVCFRLAATFPRCKAGDVDCILATINRLLATGQNGNEIKAQCVLLDYNNSSTSTLNTHIHKNHIRTPGTRFACDWTVSLDAANCDEPDWTTDCVKCETAQHGHIVCWLESNASRASGVSIPATNILNTNLIKLHIHRRGFEKDPHRSPFEIYTETPTVQVLNNYQATAHIFGIPVVDNGRSNSTLGNAQTFNNKATKLMMFSFFIVYRKF